ncbi:hypothetical protein [Roseovarius faecimaris]|nr:hypothetical protein [Roseovarius faecimaris]
MKMWRKLKVIAAMLVFALPGIATAQDKALTLAVPEALVETGLLKHILPRFSLKTGIRITLAEDAAEATLGTQGMAVFRQGEVIWHLSHGEDADAQTFADWLTSDVGKRTVEGFAPEGVALFSADVAVEEVVTEVVLTGDAVLGEEVSLRQCGRCHVVGEKNRMSAIGSTPSFALMRTFPDWLARFEGFYLLKPHPAFTQIPGVTDPFPENLPSPIAPIEVTLDELQAITAFVSAIAPADLGGMVDAGGAFQTE